MILNAYAVLCAFVAALELFFSLMVVALGISTRRKHRLANTADAVLQPWSSAAEPTEERSVLLSLLAGLLLLLTLASWPLLYLLLQSYVSEWPDVMCTVFPLGASMLLTAARDSPPSALGVKQSSPPTR